MHFCDFYDSNFEVIKTTTFLAPIHSSLHKLMIDYNELVRVESTILTAMIAKRLLPMKVELDSQHANFL